MKIHTIPLHIGDLTKDTYHLSALEFGAYMRLIIKHYDLPDGIPENMIQRYTGIPNRNFNAVKEVLKPYFKHSKDGLWIHKRVLEIRKGLLSKSTLNRDKALKRWDSDDATASAGQCHGNATAMQSINHKPEAINQVEKKYIKKRKSLDDLCLDDVSDWLNQKRIIGKFTNVDETALLERFKDYCKSHGKAYNDYTAAFRNAFEWNNTPKIKDENNGKSKDPIEQGKQLLDRLAKGELD
jgi:uncharacterized protein YdaU (DUF1376 family)